MKKLQSAAVLLFVLDAGSASGASMTSLDRQRLVAHLEMSESWLVDESSGLSDARLRFRPAPGTWTILDVVEHLVVSEPIYWQDLQKAMKAAPGTAKLTGTDDGVLWYGIDRTDRQKAIPAEEPKGQLRDLQTGIEAFRKLRAQMLQYARTTDDDLRGHIVEREKCDAYQWLLLISAHAQRHVLQIREIKANPRFPKQ